MTKIFEISNFLDIESFWKFAQPETMNLEFKQDLSKDGKEIAKDIANQFKETTLCWGIDN